MKPLYRRARPRNVTGAGNARVPNPANRILGFDVARAITFLLEPGNYVTGQILAVDGGLTTKM